MFRLDNRVALVTGAAGGIGRGVALVLSRQGAAVILNDIDADGLNETKAQVEAAEGSALFAAFDVTDYDACTRGIAEAESELGLVDILVNNAGGTGGKWPTAFLDTPRIVDIRRMVSERCGADSPACLSSLAKGKT